ncbi:hypothetical protein [Pseudomonas aeruginosa]|uniref:hypothetical protein n=1 Tax=Pseudomonas aeruginosa TaxID=287 RepID=UPI00287F84FC|nr:hypothetical protein [Pseudomonas aeruginosa]
MKKGSLAVSVLALLSLTGCASQSKPVSARELLFSSLAGGQILVWSYERDYQLDAQQASTLKAAANGDPVMLAANIVEQSASGHPAPASIPVALSCIHPNLIVITSNTLTQKYVDQGCTIVRQV